MRKFVIMSTTAVTCLMPEGALARGATVQPPVTASQDSPVPTGAAAGDARPGGASSSSEQSSGAAAQTDASGLQDIVVTAQRRAESAQRAAIAINVVGGADLISRGVTSSTTLGNLVPSLTIQQIGQSNTSFIRGVGNFSVVVTNDAAVAFNYDGVYVGRITATSGTFFDLDRIEVLKGPQGTLYGRNATAGVINVLPTQPKIGEFSGYGAVSYGNYNALVSEGAVNVPLGTDAAFRLSGTFTDRNGYLKDGTSDDKTQAMRLQFKARPLPGLMIRLATDYTHLGGKGQGFSFLDRLVGTSVVPVGLPRSEGLLTSAAQAFYQSLGAGAIGQVRKTRDPFPQLFRKSDFYGVNGEIVYDTEAGALTILPAARWNHVRNLNGAGGFPVANDERDHQYSVEGRFAGKVSMFDYTLGAFYYKEHVHLNSGAFNFGSNASFADPTAQDTESYAPFARLTANLTPQLRLVGGIRYTHDRKVLKATSISLTVNCNVPFTCVNPVLPIAAAYPEGEPFTIPAASGQTIPGPIAGTSVSRSDAVFNSKAIFPHTTYRGAIEYDLTPSSLLYGSFETGFRSGGFNNSVGFETYQPEYISAWTLGSKNRFFRNRLQLNVEGFYWRYRNQQVAHPAFDKAIPPRANSITENIGRSTIKGVEVEVRALATKTTVLSADVEYLDAEDKSFTYQTSSFLAGPIGCPSTAGAGGLLIVNCSGFPSFAAPKWSLNLAVQQTVPLGGYKLAGGIDTQYKTKRYLGFEYLPQELQGASWTTNAQISFGPANDTWSISGFVRNIENDRLLAAPFSFANVLVAYTTAPRTYGVRGSVKF